MKEPITYSIEDLYELIYESKDYDEYSCFVDKKDMTPKVIHKKD